MKLNVKAMAIAGGLLWGACIFLAGVGNLVWPPYGGSFLNLAASIYPGYQPAGGIGSVVIGTLYALVDGAVGGAVFAWLYNRFA